MRGNIKWSPGRNARPNMGRGGGAGGRRFAINKKLMPLPFCSTFQANKNALRQSKRNGPPAPHYTRFARFDIRNRMELMSNQNTLFAFTTCGARSIADEDRLSVCEGWLAALQKWILPTWACSTLLLSAYISEWHHYKPSFINPNSRALIHKSHVFKMEFILFVCVLGPY